MSARIEEVTFVLTRNSGWLRSLAGCWLAIMREWRRRSRSRAALATLDERMLQDLGISRCDAWREINKPFWRD